MPKPEMFENVKIDNNIQTRQAEEDDLNILRDIESIGINEVGENSSSTISNIWIVLKTPAFHLIWYCALIYLWVFGIIYLILIDFSIDHGLTKEDSQSMVIFESIGEVFGRLVLTSLVDMRLMSNKNVVTLI